VNPSFKNILYAGLLLAFVFYTGGVYMLSVVDKSVNSQPVMSGKMIWQQKNCSACHQLYGLGGFLGPDLTNIYSNKEKGPAYIKAFVQNGTTVMPSFHLPDHDMDALLAFFQQVDASGKADPKNYSTKFNGTIERK